MEDYPINTGEQLYFKVQGYLNSYNPDGSINVGSYFLLRDYYYVGYQIIAPWLPCQKPYLDNLNITNIDINSFKIEYQTIGVTIQVYNLNGDSPILMQEYDSLGNIDIQTISITGLLTNTTYNIKIVQNWYYHSPSTIYCNNTDNIVEYYRTITTEDNPPPQNPPPQDPPPQDPCQNVLQPIVSNITISSITQTNFYISFKIYNTNSAVVQLQKKTGDVYSSFTDRWSNNSIVNNNNNTSSIISHIIGGGTVHTGGNYLEQGTCYKLRIKQTSTYNNCSKITYSQETIINTLFPDCTPQPTITQLSSTNITSTSLYQNFTINYDTINQTLYFPSWKLQINDGTQWSDVMIGTKTGQKSILIQNLSINCFQWRVQQTSLYYNNGTGVITSQCNQVTSTSGIQYFTLQQSYCTYPEIDFLSTTHILSNGITQNFHINNQTQYIIKISDNAGSTWTDSYTSEIGTFNNIWINENLIDLLQNTDYILKVYQLNNGNDCTQSVTESGQILVSTASDLCTLPTISLISIDVINQYDVDITFYLQNQSRFEVYIQLQSSSNWILNSLHDQVYTEQTEINWHIENLLQSTQYKFKIIQKNNTTGCIQSLTEMSQQEIEENKFTTDIMNCQSPLFNSIILSSISNTSCTINFTLIHQTQYTIEISNDSSIWTSYHTGTSSGSIVHTISDLQADSTYYFRINQTNYTEDYCNQKTQISEIITLQTDKDFCDIPSITSINATNITSNEITINFTLVNTTNYSIQYKRQIDNNWKLFISSDGTGYKSHTIQGLCGQTQYQYKITQINVFYYCKQNTYITQDLPFTTIPDRFFCTYPIFEDIETVIEDTTHNSIHIRFKIYNQTTFSIYYKEQSDIAQQYIQYNIDTILGQKDYIIEGLESDTCYIWKIEQENQLSGCNQQICSILEDNSNTHICTLSDPNFTKYINQMELYCRYGQNTGIEYQCQDGVITFSSKDEQSSKYSLNYPIFTPIDNGIQTSIERYLRFKITYIRPGYTLNNFNIFQYSPKVQGITIYCKNQQQYSTPTTYNNSDWKQEYGFYNITDNGDFKLTLNELDNFFIDTIDTFLDYFILVMELNQNQNVNTQNIIFRVSYDENPI